MTSPSGTPLARSGADVLADTLHGLGARHVCHIPGEGILEMLDALARRHPDVRLTSFRHEAGMAYAAQAIGRLGDVPGVCLAARAPGALNTTLALHTADTDSAPLLLIVGQSAQEQAERDPLSGRDLAEVFVPLAKAVITVHAAHRIPEQLARAWHIASGGRPGPVVVIVPEDVVQERVAIGDVTRPSPTRAAVGRAQRAELQALVAAAVRPLLIVGGGGWTEEDHAALGALAASHRWPVVTGYRRADLVDNAHAGFAGELGIGIDPALALFVAEADLLIVVNLRLGELNTFAAGGFGGFRLLKSPRADQRLIHFHPGDDELQRVFQADLAVQAGPTESLEALASCARGGAATQDWQGRLRSARVAFTRGGVCPGPLDMKALIKSLRAHLPADAVVTVGAGAYAVWLHRYFEWRLPGTLLGPESGAMGYGLSAAIGASLCRPAARVVALAGDGCFLMHAEELATAVQNGSRILVLVFDNQAYGAIAATQERLFGRVTGTALHNPDFVAYARAFGVHAEAVEATADFVPALQRCLAVDGPSLLAVRLPAGLGKPS